MGKKILLADDSITIQKVIELTFSDEDFDVVTVGNGRLALEKLPEVRPDIVLCDIIMPEKDGYEVCEHIKTNPTYAHVPVLLLTGAFEPFDQERAARVRLRRLPGQALRARDADREGQGPARPRARADGGAGTASVGAVDGRLRASPAGPALPRARPLRPCPRPRRPLRRRRPRASSPTSPSAAWTHRRSPSRRPSREPTASLP